MHHNSRAIQAEQRLGTRQSYILTTLLEALSSFIYFGPMMVTQIAMTTKAGKLALTNLTLIEIFIQLT